MALCFGDGGASFTEHFGDTKQQVGFRVIGLNCLDEHEEIAGAAIEFGQKIGRAGKFAGVCLGRDVPRDYPITEGAITSYDSPWLPGLVDLRCTPLFGHRSGFSGRGGLRGFGRLFGFFQAKRHKIEYNFLDHFDGLDAEFSIGCGRDADQIGLIKFDQQNAPTLTPFA